MAYVHLFQTIDEYNSARTPENYKEPWVSYTVENSGISYNKTEKEKLLETPLTFNISSSGHVYFMCVYPLGSKTIQYRKNDGEWTNLTSNINKIATTAITVSGLNGTFVYGGYDENYGEYFWRNGNVYLYYYGSSQVSVGDNVHDGDYIEEYQVLTAQDEFLGTEISVVSGDRLQFKGDNANYWVSGLVYDEEPVNYFKTSCAFDIEGNIMSLIDSTGYTTATTLASSHTFSYLFYNCTGLTSDGKLILPATTLASDCYGNMFVGCTSLATAPALPATTLAPYCYSSMFAECTSLTRAPELPATALTQSCYSSMFRDCRSFTTAPELPATTLADSCYAGMFAGCTGLTTAPALPVTALTPSCYDGMFNGCTSLTTAPELPATALTQSCYEGMFGNCTSLTTAPTLPATTLAPYCYRSMFNGCTSLTAAPELPATTLAAECYESMFRSCTNLTTAPALPATTLAYQCYKEMFEYCSNLTTAPALPATTLAYQCYEYMFLKCTSLTTAPELPATTLAQNCYEYMFRECTSLTTVPELPATTLANSCYSYMFYGCSNLNYIKCLATDISASRCTQGWVSGVASSGTFVKPSTTDWSSKTGSDGIPANWTVQDA